MRSLLLTGLSLLLSVAGAGKTSASGPVHVSGYTTKNGTYVAPYYRRAPGTAGSTYTSPTVRVYSSCADARASGRWNILRTDPDYSPTLDRDSDGIACEAGSDGTSNGRDPDPVVTSRSVMSAGSASNPITVAATYPQILAATLGWRDSIIACQAVAARHDAEFSASTNTTGPVYLITDAFIDPALTPQQVMAAINAVPATVTAGWSAAGAGMTETVRLAAEPGVSYVTELVQALGGYTGICVSAYGDRG